MLTKQKPLIDFNSIPCYFGALTIKGTPDEYG